jgi:hypothetical protein
MTSAQYQRLLESLRQPFSVASLRAMANDARELARLLPEQRTALVLTWLGCRCLEQHWDGEPLPADHPEWIARDLGPAAEKAIQTGVPEDIAVLASKVLWARDQKLGP